MAIDENTFQALVRRVIALEQAVVNPAPPAPVTPPAEYTLGEDIIGVINGLTSSHAALASRMTALEELMTGKAPAAPSAT